MIFSYIKPQLTPPDDLTSRYYPVCTEENNSLPRFTRVSSGMSLRCESLFPVLSWCILSNYNYLFLISRDTALEHNNFPPDIKSAHPFILLISFIIMSLTSCHIIATMISFNNKTERFCSLADKNSVLLKNQQPEAIYSIVGFSFLKDLLFIS